MNIADLFIRRPVMTTLCSLAIVFFGLMAYRLLPVNDLPNVDFPTIVVFAGLPGASPETMASSIATPLEKQFSTIAGLDSMTSSSVQGMTNVTLQFTLSRNIDAAGQDVQAAITATLAQLPPGMPSPPIFRKVNPADQPVLYLSASSSTMPMSSVDEYAETFLGQRISMVSGVAQVQVYGSQKYAVRIQLDPKALASRGLGIDEVAQAVASANVDEPTGTLWGKNQAYTVDTRGQLTSAAAYRPLVVAYRNGAPVRLGEIGRVLDSTQDDKVASWSNGEPSVVLAVQRQPGTNTVEVVNNVLKLLPTFRAEVPAGLHIDILGDRSETIRESVNDVQFTLVLTVCLVVMVIFLFLRNLSATVIPSLALPMSIIGTFGVMWALNYSLDNLSLMAITLAVGFVVDDAIVMLENIVRHMEMGQDVLSAALEGAREIGFTIVSMTISLAAVFIPVLFMGGILGRLLHEFAVTIGAAILVSGFISLTLTPMLCSRFLKPPESERHGRLYASTERFFDGMRSGYRRSLAWVMSHRLGAMVFSGVMLLATVYMFKVVPKGFIPEEDTDTIIAFSLAAQGISFDAMKEHQLALVHLLQNDPNIRRFFSNAGAGGPGGGTNSGIFYVHLKPRSQRKLGVKEIIERWRPIANSIPGLQVFFMNPPPIRVGAQFTRSMYQLTLQSTETRTLYKYAPILEARMRGLPDIKGVNSDLQVQNPQVSIDIDRDKARTLGVSAQAIEDALYDAYGARQISTIYAPTNEYWVIMEVEPQYQMDPGTLALLYVRSQTGDLVPLDTLVKFTRTLGPLQINHFGQLPSSTISFDVAPGASLGKALDEVKKLAANTLPDSITASFQGTAQAFQASMGNLGVLLVMTILVIYLVLGILYESFIHPVTILSGLPSAGFGALVTLWALGFELDLFAFVGVIMLVGLVKKNAIMMIDFALDAQRNEGKTPAEAIFEGAIIRFRPIMMTTAAALMGTLPIALGFGAGAESRRPLGVAVVGGLFFSQFLTLYITPVVYTYMEAFLEWLNAMRERRTRTPAEAPAPAPALDAGAAQPDNRRLAS
ncbi:MAG TPA: efflux RND transporter permease subunit [Candidatus Binataceae bacterium]|nr:efflux RND transporter permease subunit [Candidatus Binataceae bacterium]